MYRIPMENLIGINGESVLAAIGFTRQLVSMGHQSCGALELWNYPTWLRDLVVQDVDGEERLPHVDLPVLEGINTIINIRISSKNVYNGINFLANDSVFRDRERNIARYNQFRRGLMMIPISKWEDLTDDEEAIQVLKEVYGDDVEELDLQVGLMAEKKIKGFAISETAFFTFILMASR